MQVRTDNAQLITECNGVMNTWPDNNPNNNIDNNFTNMFQTAEVSDTTPIYKEVQKSIIKLESHKAPSSENIPAEFLKCGGKTHPATPHLI